MSDILLDVQHLTHCFPLPGRQTLRAVDDVSFQLKDRKSTRLNSSHANESRMPSSA